MLAQPLGAYSKATRSSQLTSSPEDPFTKRTVVVRISYKVVPSQRLHSRAHLLIPCIILSSTAENLRFPLYICRFQQVPS
jgi:hypothetical protein